MCAIFGLVGSYPPPSYDPMVMRHRGPDGYREWRSKLGETPVFFAHHRLKVVDPSSIADQPMRSDDARYVLNFNGEIFNYKDLRSKMEDKGIIFHTNSDTEVFLQGLIFFGMGFQNFCNGMWAFCLWDRLTQRAFFGRDRFGEKPFYYSMQPSESGDCFLYASEIKGVSYLTPSKDPHPYLDQILRYPFLIESTEHTYLKSVSRLPAGTYGIFTKGRLSISRWWNPTDHINPTQKVYSQQVDEFKELFLDSLKLRVDDLSDYAITCSGGLDSSSILASISKYNQGGVAVAYTMTYPNSLLDESGWVRSLCSSCKFPLKEEIVTVPSFAEVLNALYVLDDPYLIIGTPMISLYRKISQDGIRVSIDGHGADELVGGYFDFLDGVGGLSYSQYSGFRKLQNELLGKSDPHNPMLNFFGWAGHSIKSSCFPLLSHSKSKVCSLWDKQRYDFVYDLKKPYYSNNANYIELDMVNKKFFDLYNHTLLPTLLRNYDRFSMAHGIEVRSPFLDYRLASLAFSLPSNSKLGGGMSKRILRDSMCGVVPDNVRLRKDKISWLSPTRDWFMGPLRGDLYDYFMSHQNNRGVYLLNRLKTEDVTHPLLFELWKTYTFGSSLTR